MSEKPTVEAVAAARAVVAEWLLHGDWTGPEQCVPALARGFDAFADSAVREAVARMMTWERNTLPVPEAARREGPPAPAFPWDDCCEVCGRTGAPGSSRPVVPSPTPAPTGDGITAEDREWALKEAKRIWAHTPSNRMQDIIEDAMLDALARGRGSRP